MVVPPVEHCENLSKQVDSFEALVSLVNAVHWCSVETESDAVC